MSITNLMAGERAKSAKQILEAKIGQGTTSARLTYDAILNNVPQDAIVRSSALAFPVREKDVAVNFGNGDQGLHPNAVGQLAGRAGVPAEYLRDLVGSKEDWKRGLGAQILGEHFHQGAPGMRHLVRTVNGQAKAFLSDKYRRLDSRPLATAMIEECNKIGAQLVDGSMTETRVSLKAIIPMVYEPVQGEAIAFGVEWSNSDFGNGAHSVRAFILRLWCLNGATTDNNLSQVHLGGKLAEDIQFSQRTYALDTQTSVSALRDVVRGTLGDKGIAAQVQRIVTAQEQGITWNTVNARLTKVLHKNELKAAKDAFESSDVINLPAGDTMWRASNAISWIAKNTEDSERKLDLERAAGALVTV